MRIIIYSSMKKLIIVKLLIRDFVQYASPNVCSIGICLLSIRLNLICLTCKVFYSSIKYFNGTSRNFHSILISLLIRSIKGTNKLRTKNSCTISNLVARLIYIWSYAYNKFEIFLNALRHLTLSSNIFNEIFLSFDRRNI